MIHFRYNEAGSVFKSCCSQFPVSLNEKSSIVADTADVRLVRPREKEHHLQKLELSLLVKQITCKTHWVAKKYVFSL